jgi:K+-transporting ATPase A subunit
VTIGQFAASLVLGVLSILLPLVIVISIVAACVYVARWWNDRKS